MKSLVELFGVIKQKVQSGNAQDAKPLPTVHLYSGDISTYGKERPLRYSGDWEAWKELEKTIDFDGKRKECSDEGLENYLRALLYTNSRAWVRWQLIKEYERVKDQVDYVQEHVCKEIALRINNRCSKYMVESLRQELLKQYPPRYHDRINDFVNLVVLHAAARFMVRRWKADKCRRKCFIKNINYWFELATADDSVLWDAKCSKKVVEEAKKYIDAQQEKGKGFDKHISKKNLPRAGVAAPYLFSEYMRLRNDKKHGDKLECRCMRIS